MKPRSRRATPGPSRAAHAPAPGRRADAAPAEARAERAALAIGVTLAVLALARGVLAFVPSMWGWGLNLERFVPPFAAWVLWLACALSLFPPVARRLAPALAAAGDALAGGSVWALLMWMVAAALTVLLLPDRIWHVGDFLLRQGMVDANRFESTMLLQAGPFDRLLHNVLPRILLELHVPLDGNGVGRLLGSLEMPLLAWLAIRFARTLGLRGIAATAATAVVLCGGYLGMFTGYGKAFSEMVILTAAVGVFGLDAVRTGRGLLPLGIAVAFGIGLHRSALGFLPVLALVWILWVRDRVRANRLAQSLRAPGALTGFALPVAMLAWQGPRLVATLRGYDSAVHFATPEVRAAGGLARAALSGLRPLDLFNLFVVLSPVALLIPVAAACLGRRALERREFALLAVLALPLAVALPLVVHPGQGLFRDWDDFAASGMALSLLAAWFAGEALRGAGRLRWIGVGVAAAVATSTLAWLLTQSAPGPGIRRVEAYALGPPHRSGTDQGLTWEYLGFYRYLHHQWRPAALALERAATITPTPTVLRMWALCEAEDGHLREAQRIYHLLLSRDPANRMAWYSLAAVSSQLEDYAESRRALEQLLRIDPGNTTARQLLDQIKASAPAP